MKFKYSVWTKVWVWTFVNIEFICQTCFDYFKWSETNSKVGSRADNLCELYSTAAGCSVMIRLSPPHQCSQSTSVGVCCNGAEQSQSYDGAAGGGSERVE